MCLILLHFVLFILYIFYSHVVWYIQLIEAQCLSICLPGISVFNIFNLPFWRSILVHCICPFRNEYNHDYLPAFYELCTNEILLCPFKQGNIFLQYFPYFHDIQIRRIDFTHRSTLTAPILGSVIFFAAP